MPKLPPACMSISSQASVQTQGPSSQASLQISGNNRKLPATDSRMCLKGFSPPPDTLLSRWCPAVPLSYGAPVRVKCCPKCLCAHEQRGEQSCDFKWSSGDTAVPITKTQQWHYSPVTLHNSTQEKIYKSQATGTLSSSKNLANSTYAR